MTPVIHLIHDAEVSRMKKQEPLMSDAWSTTRCCKESVAALFEAGDHFTAHPSIANCPSSHSTVSGKDPE